MSTGLIFEISSKCLRPQLKMMYRNDNDNDDGVSRSRKHERETDHDCMPKHDYIPDHAYIPVCGSTTKSLVYFTT